MFTDVSLHAMQFLGPPFTFGINTVSENITTAGLCALLQLMTTCFGWAAKSFMFMQVR